MKIDVPPTKKENTLEEDKDSWFDSYILENRISKTTFPRPFMVQMREKMYGILNEGGLYITNPEDFQDVKDAFYSYEGLTKEMDERTNNGVHYDPIHIDYIRETLYNINKIFKKSKKVELSLISEKNLENNPEKLYKEFQDYLILLDESNREKIESFF